MASEQTSGFLTGASAGAMFGPVGAVVGGIAGSLFGRSESKKRRREEARILTESTTQSYDIGATEFRDIREQREQISQTFSRNLASERARMAASGGSFEGSDWLQRQGAVARGRDISMEEIQLQEDKFYNSEAYQYIEQDFERIGGLNVERSTLRSDMDETADVFSIQTEGASGESYFTEEQASELRTYSGNLRGGKEAYLAYQQSLRPDIEGYTKYRFGSDEDKLAFESSMSDKIQRANTAFGEKIMQLELDDARRRQSDADMWGG